MTDPVAAIPGFKGLRGEILAALKRSQPLTALELAGEFGVTANAQRRHLKELEADGLVKYRREIRGVGGPVFAYRLTEKGERLFPHNYDVVLGQVLESIRNQYGSDAVVAVFRARWEELARRAKPELDKLPLPDKARRLAELLTQMGYMAESSHGESTTLREHNCTIRLIAARFPEVCAAEQAFLRDMLGADVTRYTHIASGANCCEYCIAEPASLTRRHRDEPRDEPADTNRQLQETT
jgi:DeoR family suf operon transcriptional repressor